MPAYSEDFIRRLNKQLHRGYKQLEPARKHRYELWRAFTGPKYGFSTTAHARPINLIYQIVTILKPHLIQGRPKVRVTTENPNLRQMAELSEIAVQFKLDQIMFHRTLERVVFEALMGLGCTKTALMPAGEPSHLRGYPHRAGQTYTDTVSLDDLVLDPTARSLEEAFFTGNRYRLPRKFVEQSGLYKADDEALSHLERHDYAVQQETYPKTETMSYYQTYDHESWDFLDQVELVDVWVPVDRLVVTLPWNRGATRPLRVIEWEGPDMGPYDFMTFNQVGDNILPVAPMSVVHDVDTAANEAMRKVIKRVANMKHVLGYMSPAADDAQNVVDSSDLEAIRMDNPEMMREFTFNGPDPVQYQHIGFLQNWASRLSGNTELAGGIGAGAETLGQEQMLLMNSNMRLSDMRDNVNRFAAAVAAKHGWYMHYDPFINIPLTRRPVPGVEIATEYSARTREGDWHDFNFSYTAFTRPQIDPLQQAGRQMQWATEVVPTALNLQMMTQGAFPATKFIRMVGEMLGVEGLNELAIDEQALMNVAIEQMAYPHEGKGGPASIKQNPTGHTSFNLAPQLASGARDSKTVNNGRFSSNPMSGAMQGSGGR